MLARLRPFALGPGRQLCQQYATKSSDSHPYHPKVHAWPFEISAEDAKDRMNRYLYWHKSGENANAIHDSTWRTEVLRRTAKNKLGRWPRNDEELLQNQPSLEEQWRTGAPTRNWQFEKLQPMYLPTWLVSCQYDCTYTEGGQEKRISLEMVDSPIPGHGHAPLANLWLDEDRKNSPPPRRFDSSMLITQWGDRVQPIEYTVSPFKLLDLARGRSLKAGSATFRFNQNLELSGLHPYVVPILHPVFLGVYTLPHPGLKATFILPALPPSFTDALLCQEESMYRVHKWDAPPNELRYYSPITEWNDDHFKIIARPRKDGTIPDDLSTRRRIASLAAGLKDARQSHVDWSKVGGVDDRLWRDSRVVPYVPGGDAVSAPS